MDDFEKAVLITFDQSGGTDAALKAQAQAYCESLKASPDAWVGYLQGFQASGYAEVKFWCLQSLHEFVRQRYPDLPDDSKRQIKQALLSWVRSAGGSLPPFLRNKLAQAVVAVGAVEFPSSWPCFFSDLLSCLPDDGGGGGGRVAADMLLRVLVAVDEDVISLEVPRSQEESRRSMHFKDAMREGPVSDVVDALYSLAAGLHSTDPQLAASVLGALQRYVNWIDIDLVVNERWLALLFGLVASSPGTSQGGGGGGGAALRGAAADVVAEVVAKRMEATQKIQLVQQLGAVRLCGPWRSGLPVGDAQRRGNGVAINGGGGGGGGGGGEEDGDDEDEDEEDEEEAELAGKLARLLATVAQELQEAYKKVENSVISLMAIGVAVDDAARSEAEAALTAAGSMLSDLFPALLALLTHPSPPVSAAAGPVLLTHVARLRALQKRRGGSTATAGGGGGQQAPQGPVLTPEDKAQVPAILHAVGECARFPPGGVQYPGEAPGQGRAVRAAEQEARVMERRQDVWTLLKNTSKIAPDETIAHVGGLLQRALTQRSPPPPWQEVEVAVAMLYQLGEGVSEEALKPGSGALGPLALALLQADVPCLGHRLVAAAVLEVVVRYAKVLQQQQEALPLALALFLEGGGMGHPCNAVSRRAYYLFCRLAKQLRQNLRPYLPDILAAMQPHLARIAATPGAATPGGATPGGRAAAAGAAVKAIGNGGGNVGVGVGASVAGGPAALAADDRMYAFEAVGLLLGQQEGLPAEQQLAWIGGLLDPLCANMEAALSSLGGMLSPGQPHPATVLQHCLEAITRVAKGFPLQLCTKARPEIAQLLLRALACATRAPAMLPGHKPLRYRYISMLHRLVECLGPAILQQLPACLEVLLHAETDVQDLADVLSLLCQLMLRFKAALAPLAQQVLPIALGRVHTLLGPGYDWSGRALLHPHPSGVNGGTSGGGGGGGGGVGGIAQGGGQVQPGAVTEEAREKGGLQRSYYSFLHSMAHNDLACVLLGLDGTMLEVLLADLKAGAIAHEDPAVRKTCLQVLEQLVSRCCGPAEGPTAAAAPSPATGAAQQQQQQQPGVPPLPLPSSLPPGFREFLMDLVGGEVCIRGIFEGGWLDTRDAASMTFLTEVATALKLLYCQFGDAFLAHVCTDVLQGAGYPQALQQEIAVAVRGSEVRQLRDTLKGLVQQVAAGQQQQQQQQGVR